MKCSKCFVENPSDSAVCKKCGAELASIDEMPLNTKTLQTPTRKMIKDAGIGEMIDEKYKIIDELGSGGMGVVYRAEQKEPVKRTVALKVIKLGMDTKEVVARFETEKQALAVMKHANIAKVLDAGATKSGRPFFVMELVSGIPITEYCDKHKLTTKERLELFIPVCEAVQHAHQKGVIHRDLKPSNVLIEVSEGKPVPKIIDFGIAKATEHRLTERTLFTERGQLIGTPEYMSPEQAEMAELDIDTRTDIYSLGMMLYELLVGVLPFDPRALRSAGFSEIQRIIREEEPPRASTRLSDLGDTQNSIAEQRRTDVTSLYKQLKGDLDWITMKAMEKDRTRRYSTASDLAADITRHLKKEPIIARPPSRIYNVGKFIRRHKWGVAMATLLTLAIVIGGATATIGFVRSTKAERLARQEAQTAIQVSNFLVDLFNVSDPGEARGKTITALEILNKGAKEIEQGLKEQPSIRARLMDTIGTVYMKLGLYTDADALLRRALELREELLDANDPQVAESLASLSLLLEQRGDFKEAEQIAARALDIRERTLPPDHPDIASSLHGLALIYYRQVKLKEAEHLYKRSLEIREKVFGYNHPEVAESLNDLGVLYYTQGRYEEAEKYYQQALAIRESVLGPDHPEVGRSLNGLASLYLRQQRFDETEPLYRRALSIREKSLGPVHPDVATCLNNIAILFYYRGDLTKAEKYYQQALNIRRQSLVENHPDIAVSLMNLAILYQEMGNLEESKSFYEQALTVMEKAYGQDNSEVAFLLTNIALLNIEMEDYIDAEKLLKRALEIMEEAFGPNHLQVIKCLDILGYCYSSTEKYNEAEQVYIRVLTIRENELGPEHIDLVDALNGLGHVLNKRLKYTQAEEYLLRGLEICEKNPDADPNANATCLHNLGALNFYGLRRYDIAEGFFKRALALEKKIYAPDNEDLRETIKEYAALLRFLNREKEAEALEKERR
jgi:serine/threonine protein kinase/tetratricopeptide (TPR) repeat protein